MSLRLKPAYLALEHRFELPNFLLAWILGEKKKMDFPDLFCYNIALYIKGV